MPLVNSFLVRWAHGFHTVSNIPSITTYGRRESFLSLGDVQSVAEVIKICNALFETVAIPQIGTTMAIEPSGVSDRPYTDFIKGDYVTAPAYEGGTASQRVKAITTTEDENGNLVHVPELRSVVEEEGDRVQRWLKRMANGTVGGMTSSASPSTGTGNLQLSPIDRSELPPFSLPGPLFASLSGRYRTPTALRIIRWSCDLRVAGTSTTTVRLLVNGATIGTINLLAGEQYITTPLIYSLVGNSLLQAQVVTAGNDAESLTVQVMTGG